MSAAKGVYMKCNGNPSRKARWGTQKRRECAQTGRGELY